MLLPLRRIVRRPLYATIALITITVTLAATGIAMSVVETLWLSPVSQYDTQRLVRIWEVAPGTDVPLPLTLPRIRSIASTARSLDAVAVHAEMELTLQGDEPVRLQAAAATHNFFDLYGVSPVSGRDFVEGDALERTVLLSERIWREQFGGSATTVGSTVTLNGSAFTAIGIIPDDAAISNPSVRLWIPIEPELEFLDDPTLHRLQAIGRLRPGAVVADLQSELRSPALAELAGDAGHVARAESFERWLYGETRDRARWLVLAALCMLLVAVANWTGLLTARSIELSREMAIRDSLGAPPATGYLHAVAEQAVLIALAFPLALWGTYALNRIAAGIVSDPAQVQTGFDTFTTLPLLAMAGVAVISSVLVTLVARHSVQPRLNLDLPTGGAIGGRRRARAFNVIVAGEVAGAVVLSAIAASLLQRHAELSAVDPGYRAAGLTLASVTLAGTSYGSSREVETFYRLVQEELTRHPAVSAVSAIDGLPLGEDPGVEEMLVEGRDPTLQRSDGVRLHNVLGGYLGVSGTPLVEGRDFRSTEPGSAPVAIVSQSLARSVWGERSPLGARIKLARWRDEEWRTVVGVAADVRNMGLAEAPGFIVYEPHTQFPKRQMTLMVRRAPDRMLDPAEIVRVLRTLDPRVPIELPVQFDEYIRGTIDVERRQARAGTTVAMLVVVLACVGIFGILTFHLASQRRELAMRAALGADPRMLIVHAVGVALRPSLAGAIVGSAVMLALIPIANMPLYGKPLTSAALVLVAAMIAAIIPAVRVGRVPAAEVLRDI